MARFLKMHGCGNDFVVFDERARPLGLTPTPRGRDRRPPDRRRLRPVHRHRAAAAALRRRCLHAHPQPRRRRGRGLRQRHPLRRRDLLARETGRLSQVIRTTAGDLPAEALPDGRVRVDMGPARLDWPDIPLARPMDTLHLDLAVGPARRSGGRQHGQSARDLLRRRRRGLPVARARARASSTIRCSPSAPILASRRSSHPTGSGCASGSAAPGLTLRLRLRRLRRPGERASPRPDRTPRDAGRWTAATSTIEWRERRPRADDRPGGDRLHRRDRPRGLSAMSVEILTFGCRLNAYESEVMRGHAAALADTVIVNTCAVTAEAERQARQAIRRARRERPGARIVVTGCAAQIDPAAWAGAARGRPRAGQRREAAAATSWAARTRRAAVSDIMAARETAPHLVDRVRRPRARLRAGAAGLRSSLHLLHHPVRPRPEPLACRSARSSRRSRALVDGGLPARSC